jgi:hypothetical protein
LTPSVSIPSNRVISKIYKKRKKLKGGNMAIKESIIINFLFDYDSRILIKITQAKLRKKILNVFDDYVDEIDQPLNYWISVSKITMTDIQYIKLRLKGEKNDK